MMQCLFFRIWSIILYEDYENILMFPERPQKRHPGNGSTGELKPDLEGWQNIIYLKESRDEIQWQIGWG